ncbi:MAG: ABC transporter substrate-binding protein [Rhodospirillaceae bacterium]|nr:ABC transporter substrate-binding protein [Rhodospirillaceae bacterium]
MRRPFASVVFCAVLACAGTAQAVAKRVVSLNPCLDTVLVHVAAREQIAALSHFSHQTDATTITDVALTLPITYESAEEVIALKPDLVLTSRHSSPATRSALQRLEIHAELFDVPETVNDSIAQIRRIAELLGREPQAEALIVRIEAALAASQPDSDAPKLTALVFQSNGFTPGGGTLVDELLTRTGFVNVGENYGSGKWGNVALERMIISPPQVLLSGEVASDTPTWAERVLTHPALNKVAQHITRAPFPDKLMYCGGPVLIQSVAALAQARALAIKASP